MNGITSVSVCFLSPTAIIMLVSQLTNSSQMSCLLARMVSSSFELKICGRVAMLSITGHLGVNHVGVSVNRKFLCLSSYDLHTFSLILCEPPQML